MNIQNYLGVKDRLNISQTKDLNMPLSQMAASRSNSGSLRKYSTRSPYLQKLGQGFSLPKKNNHNLSNSGVRKTLQSQKRELSREKTDNQMEFKDIYANKKNTKRSHSDLYFKEETKGNKFKLPKIQVDDRTTEKKQKQSQSSMSQTLQQSKKKKLTPIKKSFKLETAVRTKAGTNGKQSKINQDVAIVETSLPHGVKLYCVCDGHGLNGHTVSAFIKNNLIKNLKALLKKYNAETSEIKDIFEQALARTNDELLNSEINTQLSGSTVIAVFIHNNIMYSFNIGDSRAIIGNHSAGQEWKVVPLSDDQKPSREDEKQRILKFGGRVQAQKDGRGQQIGPLRVWMKDVQMPGLAMTRSFGDKAGRKAGTNGQPQLMVHKICADDKFLIVASDGVWQYLQNEQVMNIVCPFYEKNDIETAAQKILKISMQIWQRISYSRDDITVIISSLNPPTADEKQQHSPLDFDKMEESGKKQ